MALCRDIAHISGTEPGCATGIAEHGTDEMGSVTIAMVARDEADADVLWGAMRQYKNERMRRRTRASQQAEDLALLQTLGVVPTPSGEAASDPAGKLSAWLLSQTSLAGDR